MRARAAIGLLIGGVLVVLAAAVAFGESDQARRLADHADQLARSERVLSSISTTRSNLGISVVLHRTSDLDASLSEGAEEATRVMDTAAARLITEARALDQVSEAADLELLAGRIETLIPRYGAAPSQTALEEVAVELIDTLDALESEVVAVRDFTAAQVQAEGGRAGDLARVASYTVGLLGPAIALIAFRRVSQRRLARMRREEDLRRREEIAAAKVDLVAGLSHELRTPLTGIHGFSYTLIDLLDGPPDPEERPLLREIAGMMVEQTGDLSRMVDDLISFMRLSDGTMSNKPIAVDVEPATGTVIDEFAAHGIEVDLESGLLECDPIHLRQMVRNLLSNSIKHGGPSIRVTGRIEGDLYVLVVADDGEGIQGADGDPFSAFAHEGTAPLTTGSLGMGLGVVRGLADVSGGEISYRRHDGWTRFELRLPLSAADQAHAEDHVFVIEG